MADAVFVTNPIFRHPTHAPPHPLAIGRHAAALDLIAALGWHDDAATVVSTMATEAEVCRFHDPDYVACLRRAERDGAVTADDAARYRLGIEGNGIYPEVFSRPMTAAGGTLLACRLALAGRAVHHTGGGTHHARRDRASGFCYLNDAVLGLLAWLDAGLRRVAYVDIDAHHGDGVELAFAGDRRMLAISVHEQDRWPRTGLVTDRAGGAALNLPVPAALNDTEMRVLMDEVVLPALDAHAPEAIVLQCGADALAEDPQSRLMLSNNALFDVVAALMARGRPLVVLGGGGYNPFTVARAWAGVWGTLSGRTFPDAMPEAAQDVLRAIDWDGARRRPLTAELRTRLRDEPREGPVRDEIVRLVEAARKEASR